MDHLDFGIATRFAAPTWRHAVYIIPGASHAASSSVVECPSHKDRSSFADSVVQDDQPRPADVHYELSKLGDIGGVREWEEVGHLEAWTRRATRWNVFADARLPSRALLASDISN